MESRAKVLGHPIHQILIIFPLGLLSTSVAFDVVRFVTGNKKWSEASYRVIGAGLVGALAAAPFGLIDWIAIPEGTRAKRIGALHGLGNLAVAGLFGASWLLRHGNPKKNVKLPFVLSAVGGALAGVTGWLGGELVDTLGIGVEPNANANHESSLEHRPFIDIKIPRPGEGTVNGHNGRSTTTVE
jgi:uncharacterized membrane protein